MKRLVILAVFVAAFFSMFAPFSAQAQQERTVLTAQGSPYLVDFSARLSKRSDMRVHVARSGLNAAFFDWLAVEHPAAYRDSVRQSVARAVVPAMTVATGAKRVNGSCCLMATGCCPMCPTCCAQKGCTKGCCNLPACTLRPNCCKSA